MENTGTRTSIPARGPDNSISRRAMLAAIGMGGSLLAGCAGDSTKENTPTDVEPTPTSTPTDRSPTATVTATRSTTASAKETPSETEPATPTADPFNERLAFEHETVDRTKYAPSWGNQRVSGYDAWGGVAAADFDGDGREEFATGGRLGQSGGYYHIYDRSPDGAWTRHEIIDPGDFRPGVGAAPIDLDDDGRPEIVSSEWGSRLFALKADPTSEEFGTHRVVFDGFDRGPHDVLAADIDGDGQDEVIARSKDHRLLVFRSTDTDDDWEPTVVASRFPGDGTAVADLSEGPGLDIVTNNGWFENVDGTGTEWRRHPLLEESLRWDHETRIAVGDIDGDEEQEVIITESELNRNARLAVLSRTETGPWDAEVVFHAREDRRALHTLQIADLDGDGSPEIFTAEMENGKTDGVSAKPRWWALDYGEEGYQRRVLLDQNLGAHCGRVLDVDGDGRLDLVGKIWRPNDVNGADQQNHVDCLRNVTG